jgi:hypothetical protein
VPYLPKLFQVLAIAIILLKGNLTFFCHHHWAGKIFLCVYTQDRVKNMLYLLKIVFSDTYGTLRER